MIPRIVDPFFAGRQSPLSPLFCAYRRRAASEPRRPSCGSPGSIVAQRGDHRPGLLLSMSAKRTGALQRLRCTSRWVAMILIVANTRCFRIAHPLWAVRPGPASRCWWSRRRPSQATIRTTRVPVLDNKEENQYNLKLFLPPPAAETPLRIEPPPNGWHRNRAGVRHLDVGRLCLAVNYGPYSLRSQQVGLGMLAAVPPFPLEAELGIHLTEHGDAEIKMLALREIASSSGNDVVLSTVITEMNRLKGRMNFVSYSILCSQWMPDWGIARNEYQCRGMVDGLVEHGVVEFHDAFNPNNLEFPTWAIRPARTNETVRNTLGLNRPPISNPVLPTSG